MVTAIFHFCLWPGRSGHALDQAFFWAEHEFEFLSDGPLGGRRLQFFNALPGPAFYRGYDLNHADFFTDVSGL